MQCECRKLKGGRCKHAIFSYASASEPGWFCGLCTDNYCSCRCPGCMEGAPEPPYGKGKAILIVRPSGFPNKGSGRSEGWYATDYPERQTTAREHDGVHRLGVTSTTLVPIKTSDEGRSPNHGVPDHGDGDMQTVRQASPTPGAFLPYEDAKKLIQLITVSEAAARASGSELIRSMKPLSVEPVPAVPWTLILMMIMFVFILGCCCGAFAFWFTCRRQQQVAATPGMSVRAPEPSALEDASGAVAVEALADAAVAGNLVGLRRRSAVPAAPAVRQACAHSRNQKVNGSNQWIERLLCLNCGETFDQDTRLNVERKTALAAHAVRSALAASPSMSSTQVWLGESD